MALKKIPMRMCVGCREMKPKIELVRIVKSAEGEIKLDLTGKLNGRGAYICKCEECLKKAEKSNALQRALEANAAKELYEALYKELEKIEK